MQINQDTFDNVENSSSNDFFSPEECLASYWRIEKRINHRMATVIPTMAVILIVHTYFAWASMPITSGIVCTMCLIISSIFSHVAGVCAEQRENQQMFKRAINRMHDDVLTE